MPSFPLFSKRSVLNTLALAMVAATLVAGFTACTGPRRLKISDERYTRRPSMYPIEIFVGEVDIPHRRIAVIESRSYDIDSPVTREEQLEELKREARYIGADAVQELRILAKKAKGYTTDERSPIPSWKQGEYPLFFMRGTAIIYESSLRSPLVLPPGEDEETETLDPHDIPVEGLPDSDAPQ